MDMGNAVNASAHGNANRIVVAGGGYAGLHVALRLASRLRHNSGVELTLVDQHDYHQVITELPAGRRRDPRRRRGAHPS
jgi:NADH dehydrogenase FAD-containing subunit